MASTATEYYFMGSHADTVYSGDKSIPVAPGDLISLSDADLKKDENQHLVEGNLLYAKSEADKETAAATKAEKEVEK